MIADITNALFEVLGAVMVLNHCRVVVKDKAVAGVSVLSVFFFSLWGIWNLYYYPSLGQWWSFAGGIAIAVANCCWVYLLVKYSKNT
jgi:hypothetical protein